VAIYFFGKFPKVPLTMLLVHLFFNRKLANVFRHKIKSLKWWAGGLLMATHPMKHSTPDLAVPRSKFCWFPIKNLFHFTFGYLYVSWTSPHVGLMFIYLSMKPCGFVYRLNWSHNKIGTCPFLSFFGSCCLQFG
jgi:hypothetical protein